MKNVRTIKNVFFIVVIKTFLTFVIWMIIPVPRCHRHFPRLGLRRWSTILSSFYSSARINFCCFIEFLNSALKSSTFNRRAGSIVDHRHIIGHIRVEKFANQPPATDGQSLLADRLSAAVIVPPIIVFEKQWMLRLPQWIGGMIVVVVL